MIKPKIRALSDDGKKQVIELAHPNGEFKCVIHHSYVGGEPLNLNDETVIRELWKAQWDRRQEGMQR